MLRFLALTEILKIVHGSSYFHLRKPTKNVKILTWKAMAPGEIHGGAGAGGEEAVIPQGSESLMMHCAKPSVYFSNYGFLCSPTSLCFTVSLGMKSEFQNSHNCPKETMKHLYIPWLEFKIICKVSSHPLSPCTSCTMRK